MLILDHFSRIIFYKLILLMFQSLKMSKRARKLPSDEDMTIQESGKGTNRKSTPTGAKKSALESPEEEVVGHKRIIF